MTEFPLLTGARGPAAIAGGPEGNVWFAENAGPGGVGRITPSGMISEFTAGISGTVEGIALGPDGNLWFTEPAQEKIGRITPSGTVTEFSVPSGVITPAKPAEIAAGRDGNLWFTIPSGQGGIGRITPTGTITEFTSGLTSNSKPQGIAAGPDGNLWFTETANPARIGRITPEGKITEFSSGLTANSKPQSIAAGPNGNLWFTEEANPGRIGRITTTGTITQYETGLPSNIRPEGITAGTDGNVYFTEFNNPGEIGEITTAGTISQTPTPTANSQPLGITTGPNGNLWFTEVGNGGKIGTLTVAPSVGAASASNVAEQTATLAAPVGANSQATEYFFQYGPTTEYGSQTSAASAGSGATPAVVSANANGLTPASTYHFRAVATNASGTTYGPDQTFTTASAPTANTLAGSAPLTSATGTSLLFSPTVAPPSLGKTAVAAVISGVVLVRMPGATGLVALGSSQNIPIGSLVDAQHGVVRLTTAINTAGKLQSATLWRGSFAVGQPPGHGMTTFTLPRPSGCPAPARHARTGTASAARTKTPPALWAKDNHGQYSTRGQNSVATVRGTYWETVNRCDGTLTTVEQGLVSVRDLHRHRSVLVRAGHSYLAKR